MEKIIRFINKSAIILLLISFYSCGDEFAFTKKYAYLTDEGKSWAIADSVINVPFSMIDNSGISYDFSAISKKTDFSWGQSQFLFVPVQNSYCQYIYQSCSGTYGLSFSMYIYSNFLNDGFEMYGDYIHMYVSDTGFGYDLKLKDIKFVSTSEMNIYKTITSDGLKGDSVKSTVEIADSLIIRNKSFPNVLHFSLKDTLISNNKLLVNEIYYAKGIGLIKLGFNNGVFLERK